MTSSSAPPHNTPRHTPHRQAQRRRITLAGAGHWLAPLFHLVGERSPRERVLLVLALVGALAAGVYLWWERWPADDAPHSAIHTDAWQGLSAITPVAPDAWRRAAIDHGLAFTSIEIEPAGDIVITRARTQSPEAFSQFAQWAAQQGWWALDWTLEREAANRLVIDTRWHSQPEQAPQGRQQP